MSSPVKNTISESTPLEEMVRETSEVLLQITENPSALPDLKPFDLTSADRIDMAYLFIEKLKSERAFYKEQSDKFQKVVRALDKIHEQAKDALKVQMVSQGIEVLEGNISKFRNVEIEPRLEYEEPQLTSDYMTQVVSMKPDEVKIRRDLSNGKTVPGARLISNFRLTPYVNRKIKAANHE